MCKFVEKAELEIVSTKQSKEEDYLKNEFKEIKEFRKRILKMNIFKRKKKAKIRYKKYIKNKANKKFVINDENPDKKKEIKEQYIKIFCLLLIDNTNKDIVKLYLNLIKKIPVFIKENNLRPYDIEVKKYSVIFTVDEMNKIEKNIKNKNQKDIFLDFMNYIKNLDFDVDSNLSQFQMLAEKKLNSLYLFNTPIEFVEKELFYYKCYYNLLHEIVYSLMKKKDKKYYIKNRQKVIKYILDNDLYKKEQITSHRDKMNLLFLYLLSEDFSKYNDENESINFNRLIQEMPINTQDFNSGNKINTLVKINNEDYVFIKFNSKDDEKLEEEKNINTKKKDDNKKVDKKKEKKKEKKREVNIKKKKEEEEEDDEEEEEEEEKEEKEEKEGEEEEEEGEEEEEEEEKNKKGGIVIPLNKVCIKNLNNPDIYDKNCIYYYNLDALLKENEISPFIKRIKKFLKKIVNSKVYKQAIKELFPQSYKYLLYKKGREIKQFIKEKVKFYPFQDLDLSGITDKLSFSSFIPSINFQRVRNLKGKINKNIYKIGLTIVNSLHEINHANQCIIYFKGSKKDFIYTPERKQKIYGGKKEGGENLECLLFGDIINDVDLFQCLYIMNEENYKQSLTEFRENFKNLKNIIKQTNGETKFIEIQKGIFKRFYEKSKSEIQTLITNIQNDSNFIPAMTIGKSNKDLENDNYFPEKKCLLIGGREIYD